MSNRVFNIGDGQSMVVDNGSGGSKRVLVYGDASSSSTVPVYGTDPRIQYVEPYPPYGYQAQGYVDPASTHHHKHHHREHRHRSHKPVKDFFDHWKKPVRAPVSFKLPGSEDTFNIRGSGKVVFHDD